MIKLAKKDDADRAKSSQKIKSSKGSETSRNSSKAAVKTGMYAEYICFLLLFKVVMLN
jgi:hypothetical protein